MRRDRGQHRWQIRSGFEPSWLCLPALHIRGDRRNRSATAPHPFTAPSVVFMIFFWKMKKMMATGIVMITAAASLIGYCVPAES